MSAATFYGAGARGVGPLRGGRTLLEGSFTMYGTEELLDNLIKLDVNTRRPFLQLIITAAAQVILRSAKEKAPKETENLAHSLCVGGIIAPEEPTTGTDISQPVVTDSSAVVFIGSNVAYARRQELGFVGIDRLGRRYNDPGRPYLRPAFDESHEEAMVAAAVMMSSLLQQLMVLPTSGAARP